jgi:hypothetical protein
MKKIIFYSIVIILFVLGMGITSYKVMRYDFSMMPSETEASWNIEAKIKVLTKGEPVKVTLFTPSLPRNVGKLSENYTVGDYSVSEKLAKEGRSITWSTREDKGWQTFYYRIELFESQSLEAYKDEKGHDVKTTDLEFLEEPYLSTLTTLVKQVHKGTSSPTLFFIELYRRVKENDHDIKVLKQHFKSIDGYRNLFVRALSMEKIDYRLVQGLRKEDGRKNQSLLSFVEIKEGKKWNVFNLATGQEGYPENFVVWKRGAKAILEVEGGEQSEVLFTMVKEHISKDRAAEIRSQQNGRDISLFSIKNLPLDQQESFQTLLLFPVGALIMVLIRVLGGLTTSGTFMPILMAMAFVKSSLLEGIILFIIVVIIGIWLRSLLTHLNLLLVPRIAACVIVVIAIMAFISIVSNSLLLEFGRSVTFFPVIILAWTIERMFVQWEEAGASDALKKLAASLFVTCLIYIAFKSDFIRHTIYYFPEQILVILSIIIMLGNYTGFRLLEFFRFSSFDEDEVN